MATYLIKNTTTGKYVLRTTWDGVAAWTPPVGHTAELETGANQAQGLADIAAAFAASKAIDNTNQRDIARDFLLNDPSPLAKEMRAIVMVLVDELNAIRANTPNAAAGSPMPARTNVQALNAVTAKIASGSAD